MCLDKAIPHRHLDSILLHLSNSILHLHSSNTEEERHPTTTHLARKKL
jgi:hypothetical protein